MTPAYSDPLVTLYLGDCLDVMPTLEAESIDAVVTDPPYGLGFMGKHWDHGVPNVDFWREMYRVLKPGGYLLSFAGTRTVHRFGVAIEDAGFEIRDELVWIYASGFPKSLDVSKAMDRAKGNKAVELGTFIRIHREAAGLSRQDAAERVFGTRTGAFWNWEEGLPQGKHPGPDPALWPRIKEVIGAPDSEWDALLAAAEREVVGRGHAGLTAGTIANFAGTPEFDITAPATDLARKWEGWGTALKPAHEPIVMARKPLVGTVAGNVTRYGTGALNIDGSRIPSEAGGRPAVVGHDGKEVGTLYEGGFGGSHAAGKTEQGRWPSNVLLSDPELFDEPNPGVVGSGAEAGSFYSGPRKTDTAKWTGVYNDSGGTATGQPGYGDSGGYSRFFRIPERTKDEAAAHLRAHAGSSVTPDRCCAAAAQLLADLDGPDYPFAFIIPKADRAERERGLAGAPLQEMHLSGGRTVNTSKGDGTGIRENKPRANVHPTVKPIDLMRHLVRLVTPPGGVVLDPFLGSGTTALAASEEGFRCIGIEREVEYLEIAKGRLMATPMGLGLDVPATTPRAPKTHPDLSKHQPKRRAPSENYTGGWAGTTTLPQADEEPAA